MLTTAMLSSHPSVSKECLGHFLMKTEGMIATYALKDIFIIYECIFSLPKQYFNSLRTSAYIPFIITSHSGNNQILISLFVFFIINVRMCAES